MSSFECSRSTVQYDTIFAQIIIYIRNLRSPLQYKTIHCRKMIRKSFVLTSLSLFAHQVAELILSQNETFGSDHVLWVTDDAKFHPTCSTSADDAD